MSEEAPAKAEHEFEDAQKESFRKLGASMSFVGVFGLMLGVLAAFFSAVAMINGEYVGGVAGLFSSMVQLVLSAWTTSAGRSLTAIAVTRGRDVTYLMSAVGRLRWIYGVQRALIVLTVALMCVALALWFARGSSPVRWLFRG
jgi:hypothetical protein